MELGPMDSDLRQHTESLVCWHFGQPPLSRYCVSLQRCCVLLWRWTEAAYRLYVGASRHPPELRCCILLRLVAA